MVGQIVQEMPQTLKVVTMEIVYHLVKTYFKLNICSNCIFLIYLLVLISAAFQGKEKNKFTLVDNQGFNLDFRNFFILKKNPKKVF